MSGLQIVAEILTILNTSEEHTANTENVFRYTHFNIRLFGVIACSKNKNGLNQTLCHFYAHTGLIGPGETPEDGEMSEMTLPSRHRIQNSNHGGLRPSTLLLVTEVPHTTKFLRVDGEETFLFLSNRRDRETNPKRERQRC